MEESVVTLERGSEVREREELVEASELRARVADLAVSVHRCHRPIFRRLLLVRRRLRLAGLRCCCGGRVLRRRRCTRRRRWAEGGGAGDDVEDPSDLCLRSSFLVILCELKNRGEEQDDSNDVVSVFFDFLRL